MEKRLVYQFGPFSLDATAKVLLRDGEPVHLTRKAVETLLALLENAGRVLTKDELIAAVWPDRVVDEANLTQNIAVIRKALALERGNPGYIETFPGRGYRLVGPVQTFEEAPAPLHPEKRRPWRLLSVAGAIGFISLIGLVWFLRRERPDEARQELHIIPFTRLAGKEIQPGVAPDGKTVAFVWEQTSGKPPAIWSQSIPGGTPHRITDDEGPYSSPTWSPDGKSLAYLRLKDNAGEVLISGGNGEGQKRITSLLPTRFGLPNRHLDWSPDGKWLAVDDAAAMNQPLGIFLINIATGEKKRLTQPEEYSIGDIDPRFSPDGKTVSFIRALHRVNQELYTVPVAGGAPKRLTEDGKQISGQDWMADGKTIVFGSDRTGEFRVWKAPIDAPAPAKALRPTGIYGDFPIQLSMARGASALLYSVLQEDFNIWRLTLDGKTSSSDRWTPVITSSAQDASPQYSPAGEKICFRSDRSGTEQLWVSAADGSNPVQVTEGKLRPSFGHWSPDGKAIVFNNARTGDLYLASLGADGRWSNRKIEGNGYHPVFSADGQSIYAGTANAIVRMPAGGGAATEILKMRGLSMGLSPDGKTLYFILDVAGTELWRLSLETGKAEKALDGLVPYCTSCWAAAPNGIYFLGSKNSNRQTVYFHDLATGKERTVVDYPEPLLPIGSGPFSLSPDGRYLLCVRVDPSNADIMRVEPFR